MTGILAVFNNVAAEMEDDFNTWYNEQHIAERWGVAGFITARRYRCLQGPHRYFAWYETESTQVLQSDEYLERQNDPTRWTTRTMPGFRDMVRTVCDQVSVAGEGAGGCAATLAFAFEPDAVAERQQVESLFNTLLAMRGVVRVEYWRADQERSVMDSTESRMREGHDQTVHAMILVHAMDDEVMAPLVSHLPQAAAAAGLTTDGDVALWRLLFSAT